MNSSTDTSPNTSLQDPQRREALRAAGLLTAGTVASGLVSSAFAAPRGADIVAMDAMELSQHIKSKQVSCVEVMDAYLAQIKRVNPRLNAIVQLQDEGNCARRPPSATANWPGASTWAGCTGCPRR